MELKHFISSLWNHEGNANVTEAMNALHQYEDAWGQINFYNLEHWFDTNPLAYYPLERVQVSIMRSTFGVYWWEEKKAIIIEREVADKKKLHMGAKKRKLIMKKQKEKETDDIVLSQLGFFTYYLMPWRRKRFRDRLNAIHVVFDKDDPRNADIRSCFDGIDDNNPH